MPLESQLLRLVDQFLEGSLEFAEYADVYYRTYVEAPDLTTIPEAHRDFFSIAHEQLDFTDASPDAESRSFGWIDIDEYRANLQRARNEMIETLEG